MSEPEKKLERLNIQLSPDIRNRLSNLAKVTGWSVALIVRKCIDEGLSVVEQKAFADKDIQKRIEEENRRWSAASLRVEQNKSPKEKK